MKKSILLGGLLSCSLVFSCSAPSGIEIKESERAFKLYVDGVETYIKGVGGTYRLDVASQSGANAFRTWGGDVESIKKDVALATQNNMYIMQGIAMTKDSASYYDEEYKNKVREEVKLLAETFKNEKAILSWGIGNE
ncbi:hypothetical protein QUW64_17390, partial [Mediterranea massiliensis]|nr:hypothetical protein [Mediterranea massiliensis]